MKKDKSEIEKFVIFSNVIGERIDYVQGGGGNTSFKIDSNTMLIKASGYYLSQVKNNDGYAILSYPTINQFFYSEEALEAVDIEGVGSEKVRSSLIEKEGIPKLRPSVEAGFHSLLNTWVVHTHSVYSNIILCSRSAEEFLEKVFHDIDYIYIPYVNPGSRLTLEIAQKIKKYHQDNIEVPDVIFMENHGIIVHSGDPEKCLLLHQGVNERICKYLSISESDYPNVKIKEIGDNKYISDTEYLSNSLKTKEYTQESLLLNPLYPDQIVYLEDTLGKTATINSKTGEITYRMPYKQALLLEQSITAILFIMNHIKDKNLEIKYMSESDQDFIKNWESESYRKKMSKK